MDRHRGSGIGRAQRRVVAAAALAVALAAVVGVWLLERRTGPDATSAVVASPSPTPVAAWQPIPPPDPVPWTEAAVESIGNPFEPAIPPALRLDGLVDGGATMLGWGRYPAPGRNQFNDFGAVFTSGNGESWEAVPLVHGVNAASTSEVHGVAVGGLGYLAYGGVCCEPESRAVWHSTDAREWTRLEIGGDLNPAAMYFSAIAGLEDGWVAAGNSLDGRVGEIWTSGDGLTWESVLREEGGLPGSTVVDLARSLDGLVAVGTVTGPDGTYDAAIWESSDGRAWERVADDDPDLVGVGEASLQSVVAHAGGLLITGSLGTTEDRRRCEELGRLASADSGPPTALTCVSGHPQNWAVDEEGAVVPVEQAAFGPQQPIEFRVVVPGGPGLVLLGESSGPASPDTNLYVSADGIEWTMVEPALPMGQAVALGLVVRGREIVAATDFFDGTSSHLQLWVGRVE